MAGIDRDQAGLLLQALGVEAHLPLLEHGHGALAEESLCGLLHRDGNSTGMEQTALRMAVGFYLRTAAGRGELEGRSGRPVGPRPHPADHGGHLPALG